MVRVLTYLGFSILFTIVEHGIFIRDPRCLVVFSFKISFWLLGYIRFLFFYFFQFIFFLLLDFTFFVWRFLLECDC